MCMNISNLKVIMDELNKSVHSLDTNIELVNFEPIMESQSDPTVQANIKKYVTKQCFIFGFWVMILVTMTVLAISVTAIYKFHSDNQGNYHDTFAIYDEYVFTTQKEGYIISLCPPPPTPASDP